MYKRRITIYKSTRNKKRTHQPYFYQLGMMSWRVYNKYNIKTYE